MDFVIYVLLLYIKIKFPSVILRELHIDGGEYLQIKYLNKYIIKITQN
jgi:hypothetical protein